MFRHKKKVRDFVAQQTAAAPVLVIGDVDALIIIGMAADPARVSAHQRSSQQL